jgi:hypothetical protein
MQLMTSVNSMLTSLPTVMLAMTDLENKNRSRTTNTAAADQQGNSVTQHPRSKDRKTHQVLKSWQTTLQ